jgi:putative intracellular protease/amidase
MSRTLIIGAALAVGLILALRFGLPAATQAMGIHPRYDGPQYRLPGKRVLIVTTSHAQLGAGGARTGVFASEMTAPYYAFLDGGMTIDLASIAGGEIPIDPKSFLWFIEAPSDKRFHNDAEFQRKVKQSLKVDAVDFSRYDIVFLAGGWGAAYDLSDSKALARGLSQAWRNGKVVGGICHGPLGLLHATDESGNSLVKGRHLTAATDRQVAQLGIAQTPQHPERELRAAGALFESASAFRDILANHIVADGRLVTGQNQNAGTETAQIMMRIAGATPVIKETR